MPSAKSGTLAFADLRASGLVRPAAEKFAGAWLACFLVMTRSDVLRALSFEHVLRASVCGAVGAAVAVVLLAQMDRTTNSLARQVTISSIATFAGDIFAHPSHFPPQWAEPVVTATVSACIAIALWYAKRWARVFERSKRGFNASYYRRACRILFMLSMSAFLSHVCFVPIADIRELICATERPPRGGLSETRSGAIKPVSPGRQTSRCRPRE